MGDAMSVMPFPVKHAPGCIGVHYLVTDVCLMEPEKRTKGMVEPTSVWFCITTAIPEKFGPEWTWMTIATRDRGYRP